MTTPAFNPISTLFNTVRLYTQFDPYYYTVDNRPLQDMQTNTSKIAQGIDAARQANLFDTLSGDLIDTALNGVAGNSMIGLAPYSPSSLTIGVDVGAVFVPLSVNNSITQTVLKHAVLQSAVEMAYTAPVTIGQSVVYTIEAKYVDISASVTSSNFVDSGNTVSFDSYLNGVLQLQLKQGTPASTGTEAVPATSSGWIPLYNFHVAYGASTYTKIYAHANAPKLYSGTGLAKELTLGLPASGGGTSVTTLSPIPAFQLADGADSAVVATFSVDGTNLNQYRDIQVEVNYTSSVNTGNFAVAMSYAVVKSNTTMSSVSMTSPLSYETLTPPGTANYLVSTTLAGTIPGSALQSAKMIVVKLSRLGSTQSGVDTSTGNMLVTGLVAKQV